MLPCGTCRTATSRKVVPATRLLPSTELCHRFCFRWCTSFPSLDSVCHAPGDGHRDSVHCAADRIETPCILASRPADSPSLGSECEGEFPEDRVRSCRNTVRNISAQQTHYWELLILVVQVSMGMAHTGDRSIHSPAVMLVAQALVGIRSISQTQRHQTCQDKGIRRDSPH